LPKKRFTNSKRARKVASISNVYEMNFIFPCLEYDFHEKGLSVSKATSISAVNSMLNFCCGTSGSQMFVVVGDEIGVILTMTRLNIKANKIYWAFVFVFTSFRNNAMRKKRRAANIKQKR
jgi:hypothetical protein